MELRRAAGLLAAMAVFIYVLDRATKWYVVEHLDLEGVLRIEVLPPFLVFKMAWNQGVNFGLFASGSEVMRWVLIGVSVAVSAGLTMWALRRRGRAFVIGTGILVGGALGNAWDRLTYGAVADFLNTSCCGLQNPFSFNVADVAIFLGAAIIALKG